MIKRLRELFRDEIWLMWIVGALVLHSLQYMFGEPQFIIRTIAQVSYIFCIIMFMRNLNIRQDVRMKSIELMSMDFISECRKTGRGQFNYLVPYTPPERTRRWYAKLFSRHYLRIYEASFFDDGVQGFKAHKIVSVSNKQLFEMKLRGMVNTESNERAKEALDYLDVEWPIP